MRLPRIKKSWFVAGLTVAALASGAGLMGNAAPAGAQTFGSPNCDGKANCTPASNPFNTGQRRAAGCNLRGQERTFLGFPTWYHYLDGEKIDNGCRPYLHSARDIWLIAAAVLEILLRVAGMAAVIFVMWGGIQYTMSQGAPDRISNAKNIITNAVIGLVITIFATRIVGFVASRFSGAQDTNLLLPNVHLTQGTLNTALNIAFQLAGALAVIFVAWGGLTYARSNGDPAAIKQGKEMIIYALVGMVITLFAGGIIAFVVQRLG